MTTKVDFKREMRALYSVSPEPAMVDVPEMSFLMIDGHGDPNTSPEYVAAVQALYPVAYAAKFAVREATGVDFTVMPLEGLWWVDDMTKFSVGDKSDWDWTMMIMQPDPVTPEIFDTAKAAAERKHPSDALTRVRLERFAEGPAAQVMYVGPYSDEGPTIQRLHAYIADQGHGLAGKHHEIYLGDPRRTAPERLRTIIRQPVGP